MSDAEDEKSPLTSTDDIPMTFPQRVSYRGFSRLSIVSAILTSQIIGRFMEDFKSDLVFSVLCLPDPLSH